MIAKITIRTRGRKVLGIVFCMRNETRIRVPIIEKGLIDHVEVRMLGSAHKAKVEISDQDRRVNAGDAIIIQTHDYEDYISLGRQEPIHVSVNYMPRGKTGVPLMDQSMDFVGVAIEPSRILPGYYVVQKGACFYQVPISEMNECPTLSGGDGKGNSVVPG